MLILKNSLQPPPKGWIYRQKESGELIKSNSLQGLIDAVKAHRLANGYPISIDYEAEILDGVCREAPEACTEGGSSAPRHLKITDVLRFTALLGESVLRGNPRVDADEANRRAAVCADCPDNVKAAGCEGCTSQTVNNLVSTLTGAKATSQDHKLQSCKHCGCLNRAQVWFPLEMLQKHMAAEVAGRLPSYCWKKPN